VYDQKTLSFHQLLLLGPPDLRHTSS